MSDRKRDHPSVVMNDDRAIYQYLSVLGTGPAHAVGLLPPGRAPAPASEWLDLGMD